MDHLPNIIGPAPSEITFQELIDKLSVRRQETITALAEISFIPTKPSRASKPKSASPTISKVKALEKKFGMTIEQILTLVEENDDSRD